MSYGYAARTSFLGLGERPAWHEHANCRGMGPDLFFAEKGRKDIMAEAIAVCEGCPVIDQCQLAGMNSDREVGVWGGETPRQRRARRVREGVPRACLWCHTMFPSFKNVLYCCDEHRRLSDNARQRAYTEQKGAA